MNKNPFRDKKDGANPSEIYLHAYEKGFNFVNGLDFWSVDAKEAERKRITQTASRIALCILLYLLLSLYAAPYFVGKITGFYKLLFSKNYAVVVQLTTVAVQAGIYLIPALLYMKLDGVPKRATVPHHKVSSIDQFCACGMVMAVIALCTFCAQLFLKTMHLARVLPVSQPLIIPGNPGAATVYLVGILIVRAIVEEYVFHGIMMQSMRRYSDGFALTIASFAFGMIRVNIISGAFSFLLSLCIGYFVLRFGSLFSGIVLRIVTNLCLFTLTCASDYTAQRFQQLTVYVILAVMIVLGTIALVHMSRIGAPLFELQNTGNHLTALQRFAAFLSSPGFLVMILVLATMSVRYWQIL